jgi:succinyl-diaminopimelate desuccinylase
MRVDPVDLTARLVRCASVTPEEGGALSLLEGVLTGAGFACTRVDRGGVANLFARRGPRGAARTLGFNGHTDVVPVGDRDAWTRDPFGAEVADGWLYGRGATDMKSGVAAWVAAACAARLPGDGALILAITGDEEGPAEHGTRALLDWMEAQGERMDVCLVGEPTCPERMGETIKIGRRGSITAHLTFRGRQGHVAYPERALDPMPAMAGLMAELTAHRLDEGTAHFGPSTLAVVTMDVGNPATNVIPAEGRATVNVRFNDLHDGAALEGWLRARAADWAARTGVAIDVEARCSAEAFLTPPGPWSETVARAVERATGVAPALSTTGGTSDARFVKDHCPVVEHGLVGHRMHAVDERVRVEQIGQLAAIYGTVIETYFTG